MLANARQQARALMAGAAAQQQQQQHAAQRSSSGGPFRSMQAGGLTVRPNLPIVGHISCWGLYGDIGAVIPVSAADVGSRVCRYAGRVVTQMEKVCRGSSGRERQCCAPHAGLLCWQA